MIKLFASEVLPHVEKATIIITGDSEKTVAVIICDPKDSGKKVKPITVKGTAEEVETALAEAIQAVFTDNKEVLSNYKDVAADVKDTKAKTDKLPPKKTAKPAAEKTDKEEHEDLTNEEGSEVKEEVKEEVKYNKDQKAAQKKGTDALVKAKNSKDPDMVNYLTTQYVKEYEKAKMPEADIAKLKDDFAAILKEVEGSTGQAAATDAPDDGLFAAGNEPVKEEKKVEPKAEKAAAAPAKKEEPKKEVPAPPQNQDDDDTMIF